MSTKTCCDCCDEVDHTWVECGACAECCACHADEEDMIDLDWDELPRGFERRASAMRSAMYEGLD